MSKVCVLRIGLLWAVLVACAWNGANSQQPVPVNPIEISAGAVNPFGVPPSVSTTAPSGVFQASYTVAPATQGVRLAQPPNSPTVVPAQRPAATEPKPLPMPVTPPPPTTGETVPRPNSQMPLPGGVNAPITGGITLDELILFAEQNSPNLRQAAADIQAAQGHAIQVGKWTNPTLYGGSPQWTGSISQYNTWVGQDIYFGHKFALNRQAALRQVNQAQFHYVRTRFELLTAVRQSFYISLAAQRRVEVLRNLVEIAAKSKDIGIKLLKAGEGTRADSILLDIDLDRAIVAQQNAEAILEASKKRLTATIGAPRMELGPLAGELAAPLPDYELDALQQGIITQNALVGIAAQEIDRQRILIRRAEVEPYPVWNNQWGFQYGVQPPLHDQGYVQTSITVPLWNRNQGGIRQARANYASAVAALDRTRNDLSGLAAEVIGRYRSAKQLVERFEQQILPKAAESQRITQLLFAQGQIDFMRLLQAQRTFIEVNLAYINAQETRWTAAAELAGLLQSDQFP